ncbi:hypothetical protein RRG08_009963 [Elysia crispata]|uniref:Centrosome and spindle pole-associated protein 1 C-terminal domain-containing protein n=1 Tax=Elysia crispata TaxID=231223 RepID=A0AAE1B3X9_9GAST|nr:hypothetical protein RRG08_009963 [Elysia crispata]
MDVSYYRTAVDKQLCIKEENLQPQQHLNKAINSVVDEAMEVRLPQRRHFEEENLMLGSEEHEARRERLKRQRHHEMREFQKRHILQVLLTSWPDHCAVNSSSPAPSTSTIRSDTGDNSRPSLGKYRNSADYRNHLARQRNQEYNNWLYKRQRDELPQFGAQNDRESPYVGVSRAEVKQSQSIESVGARPRWYQEHINVHQKGEDFAISSRQHPEGLRHLKHEALALDSPEGLPLGGYEEHRKKLDEERRKEYLELQRRKAGQQAWDQKPGASSEGLLIKADPGQERLQQLKEERNLEYKQLLAQKRKLPTPERYGLPREVDEAEDFGMLHNLGARDKEMPKQGDPPASQLKLSGHGIMDNAIRRDYPPRSLREQTDEYKAATFGSNESDAAKLQKIKKRNEEYNQFLASKAEKQGQRRAGEGGQGEGGVYATIPGLRYSTSAQKRELQDERNREYNEMLRNKATRGQRSQPPAAPKQGWGTPTYEEMLDKKRAQESQYRKANDLNFEGDHNVKETERRISELDREVATKQDILRRKKQYAGILEDPDWLSPRHYLVPDQSRGLSEPRRGNQQDGQYFATLPLGQKYIITPRQYAADPLWRGHGWPYRGSQPVDEQSRRKEEYKRDLQRQMAEAQLARKTERAHGILVNNNNLANEQLTSPRLLYSDLTPRRRPDLELEAYHSKILDGINKLDNATPRGRASLGRRPPSSDRRGAGGLNLGLGAGPAPAGGRQGALAGGGGGGGILDLGFDSVLGGPRLTTIEPPAGLQYQPSTYITANNVPTLNTSVDEAYNFYASLNPLDPSLANGGYWSTMATNLVMPSTLCPCTAAMTENQDLQGFRRPGVPGFAEPSGHCPSLDCSQNPDCVCGCKASRSSLGTGCRGGGLTSSSGVCREEPRAELNLSQNRQAAPAGGRAGEREGGGGRGGGGGGRQGVPPLELDGIGGDRASKVRFADSRRNRPGPATGMDFGTDEDRKRDQREQQNAYREELERQMVEKNIKKEREREERERYEKKMEEEARNYDPFGKGGGGAPMRDQHGNVISDLRQMRSDNINRGNDQYTPRFAPPPSYSPELQLSGRGGAGGNATRAANSYRDDLIGPPPVQTTAEGETSHARGGHGIFGMPKTEAEKTQADRYKSELKRQIEEKKMEEMRKKEQQRLEEEREQRILDEQRAKMQQEYEMEQAKIKAKEEEARKKNEEMMRAAEEKKLELERKRREADEDRQRQLREEREREQQESLKAEQGERGKSPPIPTLATKSQETSQTEENKGDKKTKSVSPPVPATRTKTATPDQGSRLANPSYGRPQSSDVLNQLANMRAQLQNERRRVQTMLDDQEDEVEIYDPRQVQRPPPGPVLNSRPEIDVFETAMTRNPVAVRRTPADRHHPDRQIAEEFQSLKHKGTDSRKHLRARYPDEPITDSALEHQQDALIRRQEDQLRGGRDHGLALDDRRDMRSSSSQLHSNSAFVEVNNLGHFPDDFEDMPRRNDSARHRRRNRLSSSPRVLTPDFNSRATFGSQTSLNVDRLARKNEERLRKLRDLQGDDVSLYDPEDVLDRFMTKQAHNRPPSRNTLLDDTWLRAGSKQSKY